MEREMKIEIHVAENGKSYELECQPSTTIQELQSILPQISGIPAQDQMLITAQDNRLEAHRTLHSYGLPNKSKLVFLFNRCRLAVNSPFPPPEDYEIINVEVPPPPAVIGGHPLEEASDPALQALPSYERRFKYHYERGLAIITASQIKFDASRRLLREQEMQDKAMETARGNMDHFYKIMKQNYLEFMRNYNRQYKQQSELLANFDRDLDRLRNCRLHPGLCSPQFKTLLDCVKEARVRKWAEDCANSFRQLNGKVADLKDSYSRLDSNVQALFNAKPIVNVKKLAETIEDHGQFIEEQASIIQSLSKDVNTVKKLVDDCVSSQHSTQRNGPLRPHDAVSALGPMYEGHEKIHLPRMEECDGELGKLLKYCQDRKTAMTRSVHSRLQSVASLQSNLKDLRNQLAVFKEAMNRQAEYFTELRIVRRMGSAYKACLAEVVRRKAWMKLFMGQAGQLAERMARKREVEVARRDEFLKEHLLFFSREVLELLGLYENPSQCVVNMPPFDTNLLDLDIVDVERYAPESLVGPMLKISGTDGRGGSTRSLSDSTFQSGSESPSGAREDYEGEVDDYGDSDEINGTSKLEVENAWLKAELASAVARLCHLVPECEPEEAGEMDDSQPKKDGSNQSRSALQSTNDALRLKDEYAKHLRGLLNMRTNQCKSYEKRIRELEQRLQDQHLQMQKFSSGHNNPDRRYNDADSEISGLTALRGPGVPEPMDEGASSLAVYEGQQHNQSNRANREVETETMQSVREREALDETMSDVSGVVSGLDAAMEEGPRRSDVESTLDRSSSGVVEVVNVISRLIEDSVIESGSRNAASPLPEIPGIEEMGARVRDEHVLALQNILVQKNQECETVEERLRVALAELGQVRSELDSNAELLNECQMNCAHLENRLHEAREEARINLCAADRRATEYNALRASSVRLRGLTERLRSCISTTGVGFAESLRALAVSLSSPSISDSGEDVEFRNSVRILAEKVGVLAQQRAELLERCTVAENNQGHLTKTLDELKKKRQMEKQASKEMICFTRFHVHGLAVFIPNGSGHYEALNRNCPNYFLSDESIALFLENLPNGQHYIVGQIVHIDRGVTRSSSSPGESEISGSGVGGNSRSRSNPYGIPLGTEYFVVTVAMVPDFSSLTVTI